MRIPTFTDVLEARRLLAAYLPPTPLWSYPVLDATVGATTFVKHENMQPTGAFKVRGGLNLLAAMAPDERVRGVVAYSTGNHAQSAAFAAREFGVPCTIVMPEAANSAKAQAVVALGAELVLHGVDLAEAAERARVLAEKSGARLLSVGNEPLLIAGVATAYLELFTAVPDLDAVFVPVGSGSGAAAACLVASAIAPGCRVFAVQSDASPSAYESWRAGELVVRPDRTTVDGLATGRAFELPQQVMRERLEGFVQVSDAQIRRAQRLLLTQAHTLAEGAGAAALAGLLTLREQFAGRKVAVIATGGNASAEEIALVLAAGS